LELSFIHHYNANII